MAGLVGNRAPLLACLLGFLRTAGVRLARSASRAQRDGGYRSLPLRLRNVPDPSFWRGIAGIAYAMLVYADALESPTLHAYPVFYC